MTAVNPPSYLQYGSHSAVSDRLTAASFLQPGATPMSTRGGVRMSGDNGSLKVNPQATPNNTVTVAAGTAYVPESDGQGVYVAHNDAAVTLTIANASTTQNRKDLIVAQVSDQEVSGITNLWAINVITGTAVSGTATVPAVPSNSLALAEINVPAGTTTVIGASSITDRRITAAAAGGLLPAVSTALPSSPYDKMAIYCGDTDEVRVWSASASAWRVLSMYPLPTPVRLGPPVATQAITQTVFSSLPTRQYIDFTVAKSCWVQLNLGGWLDSRSGTFVRATIALTNATVGPGTNGAIVTSGGAEWGLCLYTLTGSYQHDYVSVPWLLNAGTTRVETAAYRGDTANSPSFNYSVLSITPLRYA